jgi:hypothetical protein
MAGACGTRPTRRSTPFVIGEGRVVLGSSVNVGLVIAVIVIVLIGGTIFCLAWWKLADAWFPGASRKTGQEIRLRRERPDRTAGATVIKGYGREADDTSERGS